MHKKRLAAGMLCLACFYFGAARLPAAKVTWDNGGDGVKWSDNANWDAVPDWVNGDAIYLDTVSAGAVLDLDGNKAVTSLWLRTDSTSYSITNNVLTLKSGRLYRSKWYAAGINEKIYSDIVLGADGVFDIDSVAGNNNADGNLATFIYGSIGDGGNGYGIKKTGAAHLYLYGNCTYGGESMAAGYGGNAFGFCILGSNATSRIIATNAAYCYIAGPCPLATELRMEYNSGIYVAHSSQVANAALCFNGGYLAAPEATNLVLNNPITLNSNALGMVGSCYITLGAPIALNRDCTFWFSTWHSQRYYALNGAISNGTGGAHQLVVDSQAGTDSHMPALITFNGTNAFTGGMITKGAGRVTLNGEMATGYLVVSNTGNTGGWGVSGNCLFHFRNNDKITVCSGKAMAANAMKFDLTGITSYQQTIVDYAGATFTATNPINNMLTAASTSLLWSITNDTGNSRVVATRPFSPGGTLFMFE